MSEEVLARRLRISALAVLFGLLVELISLTWHTPSAFLVFVGFGGLAIAAGIVFYLLTIVTKGG
jgi:hypothetical protein